MGYWDRAERRKATHLNLHPRLRKLDEDLMVTKSKRFDYLYACGDGARVRVCVMRDVDLRCYATCELAGRVLKVDGGHSPSWAFKLLTVTIHRMMMRMSQAERIAVRLENPMLTKANAEPSTKGARHSVSAQ